MHARSRRPGRCQATTQVGWIVQTPPPRCAGEPTSVSTFLEHPVMDWTEGRRVQVVGNFRPGVSSLLRIRQYYQRHTPSSGQFLDASDKNCAFDPVFEPCVGYATDDSDRLLNVLTTHYRLAPPSWRAFPMMSYATAATGGDTRSKPRARAGGPMRSAGHEWRHPETARASLSGLAKLQRKMATEGGPSAGWRWRRDDF